MRILRIKLKNLNSLRGEHAVDFEAEPLASAGLFAITGSTGAGKSTLLDAVTLGLYGHAARYGNTSNPEDMMSRHCGECQAEVDFVVPKGRYRAEWQLRRARGRADGNMQAAKRYVYDANGQVLAANIRDAEACIQDLVGLDYQRFLRSVLLAQGEFARFLKANPDERAQLLESLTGTEIYSELGRLAHAETARREADLDARERELGQVVLLSELERADRETQIRDQSQELARQKAEVPVLNQQLAQAAELRNALANETELLKQQKALAADAELAAPALTRLRDHRLTIPYAEDLGRLQSAQAAMQEQGRKLDSAEREKQRCHRAWMIGMVAAADFAVALRDREQQAVRRAEQSIADQETQKLALTQWLADHARDAALEGNLPDLAAQLERLEALRADHASASAKAAHLDTQVKNRQQVTLKLQEALQKSQAALGMRDSEKGAAVAALESALKGRTTADYEQDLEALRNQVVAIDTVVDLHETAQRQEENLAHDRKRLSDLAPELERAQAAEAAALSTRDQAAQRLGLHEDHLHKAELVASLDQHRSALKAGEACPLCGATEHPLVDQERAAVSFDDIRAEIQRARRELTAAERQAKVAGEAVTRLKAAQESLAAAIHAAAAELNAARNRAVALAEAKSLHPTDAPGLRELKAVTNQSITKLRETLAQTKQATDAVVATETARLNAENEVKLAAKTVENEEHHLALLAGQIKEQSGLMGGLAGQLATTSARLHEWLQPYAVELPPPGREQPLREALRARKTEYQHHKDALARASAGIEKAKAAAEHGRTLLADLERKARILQGGRDAHHADVAGGDADASAALRLQWASLEDAEQTLTARETALTKASASAAERKRDADQAAESLQRLAAELTARLGGSAFASMEALRAAQLGADEAARFQRLEQDLNSRSDNLKGGLDAVHAAIGRLREAKAAEGEAVVRLESSLHNLETAVEALVRATDRLTVELQTDRKNREQHAAQAAQLEQDRQRLKVWRQLQGLIGSYDGGRFRRYAQGISLDVLVCHGNQHLQRLSDRYRLQRHGGEELELQIEDLYQAGTTRPMASLSGGESFLASLALALGLADLAGRNVRIDSLFIDEGFGALDAETLDLAISTLETLRQDNKTVGVISHVELLKERIGTQIIIEKQQGGISRIRVSPP